MHSVKVLHLTFSYKETMLNDMIQWHMPHPSSYRSWTWGGGWGTRWRTSTWRRPSACASSSTVRSTPWGPTLSTLGARSTATGRCPRRYRATSWRSWGRVFKLLLQSLYFVVFQILSWPSWGGVFKALLESLYVVVFQILGPGLPGVARLCLLPIWLHA